MAQEGTTSRVRRFCGEGAMREGYIMLAHGYDFRTKFEISEIARDCDLEYFDKMSEDGLPVVGIRDNEGCVLFSWKLSEESPIEGHAEFLRRLLLNWDEIREGAITDTDEDFIKTYFGGRNGAYVEFVDLASVADDLRSLGYKFEDRDLWGYLETKPAKIQAAVQRAVVQAISGEMDRELEIRERVSDLIGQFVGDDNPSKGRLVDMIVANSRGSHDA